MAFDLVAAGGYGSGELGDVTDPVGEINTTAIAGDLMPIDDYALQLVPLDKSVGIYGDFAEDMEVLISVGGTSGFGFGTGDVDDLGLWCIASISAADSDSRDDAIMINPVEFDNEAFVKILSVIREHDTRKLRITVTSIPHFRNLTLNSGCTLSPRAIFPLVFKCSGTLTLNGGHIDLRNKGIPTDESRVNTAQETDGTTDTDLYSGWENSQTKDRFIVNNGDGAAFIIANSLVVADSSSRIGNPNTSGVQFCRGASNSRNLPSNVTNIGGSTIFIAAGTITDFNPAIIAKYRDSTATAGVGLARCYIASNTLLRNDEGLYAYDCISNPQRLAEMNITSFGDGSSGDSKLTSQLNNYAIITAIDDTRKVLTVGNMTTDGSEPFALGRLVMVHFKHKSSDNVDDTGKFILAKILGINGDDYTLDTAVPNVSLANYYCQMISIPQFRNYTLTGTNSATLKFSATRGGGIFAIAVNDTCDISGGKINVEEKGSTPAYARAGLASIGNAQDAAKLPIGAGHGSVFILAKNLTMNSNTRIGATYSGAKINGRFGGNTYNTSTTGGGYSGNYQGVSTSHATGGWGGGSGTAWLNNNTPVNAGGYGGNGYADDSGNNGKQGAHIMIIADTITGFNQAAISTGGSKVTNWLADSGSAGYGGGAGTKEGSGGGYNGGGAYYYNAGTPIGGGSSGWAFVYCNEAVNQDSTNTVLI